MKYHIALIAAFVVAGAAFIFTPINRVHAEEELILATQGSSSGVENQLFLSGPSLTTELAFLLNGTTTADVVFPQQKQLDSVRLWLGMFNNPAPTPFYIEVRQAGMTIATSTLTTVYPPSDFHLQEARFGFVDGNRVVLRPGIPYQFFLFGTGAGQGSLAMSGTILDGAESDYPYFQVYGENAESSAADMDQVSGNGTFVKEGRGLTGSSITLQAKVWSATLSSSATLEVELRSADQPFSGTAVATSSWTPSGQLAKVTFDHLAAGDYHWQARAVDPFGTASPWQEFDAVGNVDFTLDQQPGSIAGHWSDGNFPNGYCGYDPVLIVPDRDISLRSIDFWARCTNGQCNAPNTILIFPADTANILARSDAVPGFDGGDEVHVVQSFSGASQVTLRAGTTYRLTPSSEHGRCQVDTTDGKKDTFYLRGPSRDPVVLVPGTLGSALDRVSDGGEVWPNVNAMVSSANDSYLDDLKLDANGTQRAGREMKADAVIESESFAVHGQPLITHTFYGNLVKAFTDQGYVLGQDLFEAPYDWRLDLRSPTAAFRAVVNAAHAAAGNGKIAIVAHSMGTLLVKQYLASLSDTSFVDKVILVGAPQLGAPGMFKALNYGDSLGFTFPLIHKDFLNPAEIKSIAQNMPGAYDLLPSQRYVATNGPYVQDFRSNAIADLSYDDTTALMTADGNDSRNSALLSRAETFHDDLDDQPIHGPQVYNLVGCDNAATPGTIHLYENGQIDIGSTNGDGTVPLTSATRLADGYSNYFVSFPQTRIDHMGLVADNRTTKVIEQLAEGGEVSLPTGIATSSAICFPSGSNRLDDSLFRFSTHSPVALDVYDAAGNHTGPAPDGSVDTAIPGSSYERLGENSFVFVPAGSAYKVTATGLAQGHFTLKAETLNSARVASLVDYLNVPIAGTSTLATLDFFSSDARPNLFMDNNGDGLVDTVLAPSAQLSGDAAGDITPPQISVTGVPQESVPAGTSLRISFAATDDLSGVALVAADLDGTPFTNGSELAVASVGRHTITIQATDKAGNPAVAKYTFTAAATRPSSCHV